MHYSEALYMRTYTPSAILCDSIFLELPVRNVPGGQTQGAYKEAV